MFRQRSVLSLLVILAVLAARPSAAQTAHPAPAPGLDTAGMDRSVKPGDDFFDFANGTWLAHDRDPGRPQLLRGRSCARRADRPADRRRSSRSAARPNAARRLRAPQDRRLLRELHGRAAIEAKGLAPLQPTLDRIAAIARPRVARPRPRRHAARRRRRAQRHDLHTDNLFGLWVAQDLDDPSRYVPFLLQGGLGMPDRDYYLDPSPRMAEIRDKYQAHIGGDARSWPGSPTPEAQGRRASFDLERRIAEVHASRAGLGGRAEGQQPLDAGRVRRASAPGLDWSGVLRGAGLERADASSWSGSRARSPASPRSWPASRSRPGRTTSSSTPSSTASPSCRAAFVDESFAFYGTVLTRHPGAARPLEARGRRHQRRARRGGRASSTSSATSRPRRRRAQEMVRNLIAAFGERIDRLDWMAPATKARGEGQAGGAEGGGRLSRRAGADYAGLEIVRGRRASATPSARSCSSTGSDLAKLGRPVDRGEWVMTPQTGQRREPAGHERDELSRGHPAAALLRPPAAGRDGLRRHRRHDRPRDQPQLRRPGRAVRRRRAAAQLVDPGGPRALPGRRRAARPAVRRLPAVPRPGGQRQADAVREHRRRGRAGGGLRRLPPLRSAASRRRWSRASPATSSSS